MAERVARAVIFVVVALLACAPLRAAAAPDGPKQGVAVVAVGAARDEAFALARAVYATSLRPRALDELRARVLAGEAPPGVSSREARELAQLRAALTGDDAVSRRLLASIGAQLGVQALLVVEAPAAAALPQPSQDASAEALDGGQALPDASAAERSAGARLFLVETGDFDAARYEADAGAMPWRSVVRSLERRFPRPAAAAPEPAVRAAPAMRPKEGDKRPFYASPWFWGGLGAALVLGGAFYFASRDNSDDPIHLQMSIPR